MDLYDTLEKDFPYRHKSFTFIDQTKRELYRKLRALSSPKQLSVEGNDAIEIERYQHQSQKVLLTNCWFPPGLLPNDRYEQWPCTYYGLYSGPRYLTDKHITHDFNCLIRRIDPIRQSWFYQLIRRNLLPHGLVSFLGDETRSHRIDGKLLATKDVLEEHYELYLQTFKEEHVVAKTLIPYRNFDASESLQDVIMRSKFSIVLETYFDRNNCITYSEKIFRCLRLPRPWILFAQKYAVQYLKTIGFDILDDLVDHSYDDIDFAVDRQVRMLDIAQELCSLEYTPALRNRLKKAANYNNDLLDSWQKVWLRDINVGFTRAWDKCMANN